MTIDLHSISTTVLRRAVEIKETIEKLTHELSSLMHGTKASVPTPAKTGKRRKMSAAARAKIGAAQKARWAKTKKAAPVAKAASDKKRRKMSAEGRARIAAAAKARWAKVRAEKKAA